MSRLTDLLSKERNIILMFIGLMIISVLATYLLAVTVFKDNLKPSDMTAVSRPHSIYDAFSAYDKCIEAIREVMPGKIITIESDDRTASYDSYSDTNSLSFKVVYNKPLLPFLSVAYSTASTTKHCISSASTNEIVAIN